jgi:hypothetical protein
VTPEQNKLRIFLMDPDSSVIRLGVSFKLRDPLAQGRVGITPPSGSPDFSFGVVTYFGPQGATIQPQNGYPIFETIL